MIVAPEGCVLLSLDFSQIELRVGAFYCRDEKMLQTYRNGGDIHAQTTSVIYHIPFEQAADKNAEHYKERRTIAKNCNFGVFFGLFPKGLQRTLKFKAGLDTPLAECEKIIANLKAGYSQLSLWQDVVKRQANVRRYSETWLGRRRYLPGIVSDDWGQKELCRTVRHEYSYTGNRRRYFEAGPWPPDRGIAGLSVGCGLCCKSTTSWCLSCPLIRWRKRRL